MALFPLIELPSLPGEGGRRLPLFREAAWDFKNNTPLWARVISPGLTFNPPPAIALAVMVWWGLLKGLFVIKLSPLSSPAILCIFVISIHSLKSGAGKIVAMREATIVFPLPGGPIKSILCLPAAAITAALFNTS